ncbi:hypothetical protein [Paraburkholderia lacunae]|uniref:Uncharacterized protein n=1 Tax=Paraburkholderia lacunae TaxID=2211104 RepID=A0A370NBL3_9BURK|nr:hypothetical protein [Paraburkholderia lacunae]RDK02991.1 hypothetical protein DLM46_08760 [Paraburkholderia lacunae]
MLHLVYVMRPTAKARCDLPAFWRWVKERETWFYDGLDMASNPRWLVRTIGPDVHALEHSISFADEAAWGAYRKQVARQSQKPEWEHRRIEQEEWWEILDARILTDAPIPAST